MLTPHQLRIDDYAYELPAGRIARHPLAERDGCRLLEVPQDADTAVADHVFSDLEKLLEPSALLVRNNTRVIPARLLMRKPTGGAVEIFLLDPEQPADYAEAFAASGSCRWKCLVGNLKRWHSGPVSLLTPEGTRLEAFRLSDADAEGMVSIELRWADADLDFASLLEQAGRIPIPPYLERDTELSDITDYQTVYSRIRGSVAAPTAGLHFTDTLFGRLRERGIDVADVTLHVGAGTFKPVKADTMQGHTMHTERFSVERQLIEKLLLAMESGRKIYAVGTTTVRTLESLPLLGIRLMHAHRDNHVGQWEAYGPQQAEVQTADALRALLRHLDQSGSRTLHASTSLMIAPGFPWRIVGGMVTNFHQPRSTLLLLVSAFMERNGGDGNRWRRVYAHALANPAYRFLSYGDACLLL